MSEENRPNLNCAGMAAAIVDGLHQHLRGDGKTYEAEIMAYLRNDIVAYIEHLDAAVNILAMGLRLAEANSSKVAPS